MPEPAGLVRATGRRKEAIVRVRLVPGTGTWKLNGRTLDDYFPFTPMESKEASGAE